MSAIYGDKLVYGVKPPLPLKGFPPGKVRICLRHDNFAKVFVRNKTGIRHFYIAEVAGFWIPKYEQDSNHREVTA